MSKNSSKILSYQAKLEKKLFFRYLIELNKQPVVFALINEKQKKVYVQASKAPIRSIGALLEQLAKRTSPNRQLRQDVRYLHLKILEHTITPLVDKLKWLDTYKKLGYQVYNTEKLPKYVIKQEITQNYQIKLYLQSGGRRKFFVKLFNSQEETDAFIALHDVYSMLKLITR